MLTSCLAWGPVINSAMKYFILRYRLNAEDCYLIWASNDMDSVWVDPKGSIPSFKDPKTLREYASVNHLRLESEEPILHDLDWIPAWAASPVTPAACSEALAAWNLFGDVAAAVGERGSDFRQMDSAFLVIYQKLFRGNNLPSVTPKGTRYVPDWSMDETASLARVLSTGLDLFASCIRKWPNEFKGNPEGETRQTRDRKL